MKAIQFDRYGPPEVLALVEVDEPHPRAGQVRMVASYSSDTLLPTDYSRLQ